MTQLLIAANVAVFLGMLTTGAPTSLSTLRRFGAITPPPDQWWRLITSMFVHIGVAHIAFNMFALVLFGPSIERRYGRARFLGLYLATGVLAGSFSLLFSPAGFAAGASGAVFGILGAWLAVFLRHRRIPAARAQLRSIIFLIGINLLFGASVRGIDNWAHLGGLLGGFVIGSGLEAGSRLRGAGWALAPLLAYGAVIAGAAVAVGASGRLA
jgi:rhomboid protease GluP